MWYEKTKNGKVRYHERFTDPLTGLQKAVSCTLGSASRYDQKKAKLILDEKIRAASKRLGAPEKLTFEELCRLYLDDKKDFLKLQSFRVARTYCETLSGLIGEKTLVRKLNAPFVRQLLAHPDPVRYNRRIVNFKTIMNWAYRMDLVATVEWLRKLEPIPERETKAKLAQKFLEPEEVRELISAMQNVQWRLMTELLVLSGLRIGEALALTVDDIDLDARTISVTKTDAYSVHIISSTKTTAGEREVFIQDELLPVVKALLRGKTGNIFTATYKAYFTYLYRVSEETIGRRIGPHVLRHTHVALLAAAGISLDAIARRVGHENSQVTRDVYFHVTDRLREAEAEEIRQTSLIGENAEQKRSKRSKNGAKFVPFWDSMEKSKAPKKPANTRKTADL